MIKSIVAYLTMVTHMCMMIKWGLNICIVNAVVDLDDDGGKNER